MQFLFPLVADSPTAAVGCETRLLRRTISNLASYLASFFRVRPQPAGGGPEAANSNAA
jgi:hypothetical protein